MSLTETIVRFQTVAEVAELQRSAEFVRLRRRGLALVCGTAILISFSGCWGKDRLDVSPVRGQVVYNGSGVPQATVIFFPVDPADEAAQKMRPYAYADGAGQFEIKTYVIGDGAPPGKYRVSIIAPSGPPPRGSKDRPAGEETSVPATAVRIPPAIVRKYGNVDTAGIEVNVQEGENNLEPFVLTMSSGPGARAVGSASASSISSQN